MKIATTTGDFDSYVAKATDICEILLMLKESGFKHIDLNMYTSVFEGSPICGENWEYWADNILNTAQKLGLDFVQAHSSDTIYPYGEERDYKTSLIKRELEICKKLGIKGMVIHAICTGGGSKEDFIEKNAEFYRDLLETAEKTGVEIYTENTCTKNNPFYHLLTADDFHALNAAVGKHELFGCCWDVGHAHIEGVDQYNEIMNFGKWLKAVHIHDNFGVDIHQQPYTGNCKYDPIINGLIDVNFNGSFTLEAHSLPAPKDFVGRTGFEKQGKVYDKLTMLPLEFKLRSERLMYDITRYMLEAYNCFEE